MSAASAGNPVKTPERDPATILLIGTGGREHALAWHLSRSAHVARLIVAPGNPGTASLPKTSNVAISMDDVDGLLELGCRQQVDLVVIGPEKPLCNGLSDHFNQAGIFCLGPGAAAARLEGSKAFAKLFMARHGLPTAPFGVFSSSQEAMAYIDAHPKARVIKADGLASGKGVVVADSAEQARHAACDILDNGCFGEAGRQVVVEERLFGREVSLFGLIHGTDVLYLGSAQDAKRLRDGNQGPNTGGMGAFSPSQHAADDGLGQHLLQTIATALMQEGLFYSGFLYIGLLIDTHGQPHILEFNCRLGDPEAQVLLLRMQTDLAAIFLELARHNTLAGHTISTTGHALGVVLAAANYPEHPSLGALICGLEKAEQGGATVFHMGTRWHEGNLETAGGRVLTVCATANSLQDARQRVYAALPAIHFDGMQWRSDIGIQDAV